ncbi:DUF1003 domain-containing protein [Pseudofrankia asymbiotica]|uniref:DUF1003 domain-containing protein n=1 Tax=Pseudofrankia asymbiotica TaxID=1834516 RepID=A0A1V2IB18_9ACTN|nr:DUF1003 domain-containing protein [Pseudofrankia asymbiotica]ONH30210.1 hypothetical protein BL253_14910 [Pseudofrankia asymbiotica]
MTHTPDGEGTSSPPHSGRHHPKVFNERMLLAQRRTGQERFADAVTGFAGSMSFVYLHLVWFTGWILLNQGAFGDRIIFDPFPYGLLTMVVSLEAIFLSTFVMISQNRDTRRQNVRADLDYATTVRSEVWSSHIGRQLGIDPAAVEVRVQEILRQTGTPAP